MINRWPELDTRFKQYTDLTPDQIDVVREQVLIVLEDESQWPQAIEEAVEQKVNETIKEVDESLRAEIHEEILRAVVLLEDI